jgi:hypothetical protein
MIRILFATLLLPLLAPNQIQSRSPVLRYLKVGSRRIEFDVPGRATARLSTVERILHGNPEISDTTTIPPTRCYILSGPSPHMILAFYGDPMGTGTLTDFDLAPASRKPELAGKCSRLDIDPQQIVTDRGVRIGMPRDEVEEAIGQSRRAVDGQPIYEVTQERKSKLADGTIYTEKISSSLSITYRNRTVVAFSGGVVAGD